MASIIDLVIEGLEESCDRCDGAGYYWDSKKMDYAK